MDEGVAEDVASVDERDVVHLQYKDNEYSSHKPENCEMLASQEAGVQGTANSMERSFNLLAEILEGKKIPSTDPRDSCDNQHENDTRLMVEELTVETFSSSDVAVVGSSNSKEKFHTLQSQWQQLYRPADGSGGGSLHNASFPGSLPHEPFDPDCSDGGGRLKSGENKVVSSSAISNGGTKTKILSKSGFSEFFVKTTLKSKGIMCRGPSHDDFKAKCQERNSAVSIGGPKSSSDASLQVSGACRLASNNSISSHAKTSHLASPDKALRTSENGGVNLRDWLKSDNHEVSKAERLYMFKCIVDLVDCSHSKGVVLYKLRPSSFIMLQGNRVKYIGQVVREESLDHNANDIVSRHNSSSMKRAEERVMSSVAPLKKQKFNGDANFRHWPLFPRVCESEATNKTDSCRVGSQQRHSESRECYSDMKHGADAFYMAASPFGSMSDCSEEKWYVSPEEHSQRICTVFSNIYSLGVLLFELLGQFASERARAVAMSDLRHRILPPDFLSENPKEAGFCLWLLHPEPLSRPTTRDIIQSEVVNGLQEMIAEEVSISIEQEDEESELLLHFLLSLQEQKQKHASKLAVDVNFLEADIKEIARRRAAINSTGEYPSAEPSTSWPLSDVNPVARLMNNTSHLESAYFSMRTHFNLPEAHPIARPDRDMLRNFDICHSGRDSVDSDRVGAFFDGLCKYARYSKFEMRGIVRTGELNNSANVICSISFDRDEDYFAAAGVSKKIKIYEFNSLFNRAVDIPYPVIEMPNRSKLSCVCWNSYIKNYLASSDYDGTVKLWDVTTGQAILRYSEHEKRAWSVDFSQGCPMKFASGSDDCSVKLWNINESNCLGTIKNIANVCCVQFSAHSPHLLAFGSADYRAYCYDLRNLRAPWCVLAGHNKAVSYVKFVDSETLVTASTDNTLKIWDLNKTSHGGYSTSACSLTFRGHTNEKNFVGLSTADGYIACGSETNEVYAYYRSLPMPITSYKFGSIDPISGKETDDENGLFVSSVCWRGKSDTLIAANSSGCIKVLQMV